MVLPHGELGWLDAARVFRHPEVVEEQPRVPVQLTDFLRDVADALGLDQADGKPTEPRDVFRAVSGADAAAIFVVVPVENVVAAIFDRPVSAVDLEDAFGIGLLRWAAGDSVGDLVRAFAGLFVDGVAFDDKGLTEVRKVEIAIEFGGGPDLAGFDAAVIGRRVLDEGGLLAILEVQSDVAFEGGLVTLDGEVVMGGTLGHQVLGQLALGQQGVGADVLVFDVDGIEQRNGGSDFVGLFDGFGITVYRQGANFFWV